MVKHIPEISIHYGEFLSHNVFKPLAYSINKKLFGKSIKFVNIIKTEEKGSDVNLALNLLNDAWLNLYDCAIIVSNDSDLAESLRLVKIQHKKMIGLITPNKTHPSKELMQYADFNKRIRKGVLAVSQLPDPIPGTTIRKPSAWQIWPTKSDKGLIDSSPNRAFSDSWRNKRLQSVVEDHIGQPVKQLFKNVAILISEFQNLDPAVLHGFRVCAILKF